MQLRLPFCQQVLRDLAQRYFVVQVHTELDQRHGPNLLQDLGTLCKAFVNSVPVLGTGELPSDVPHHHGRLLDEIDLVNALRGRDALLAQPHCPVSHLELPLLLLLLGQEQFRDRVLLLHVASSPHLDFCTRQIHEKAPTPSRHLELLNAIQHGLGDAPATRGARRSQSGGQIEKLLGLECTSAAFLRSCRHPTGQCLLRRA
mmetsp:Transcript_50775/g.164198  ORF Transcript_50775/g.164198 Transcript_50775/m.164198 type:complete len:202 (+) Transcript_50775:2607-3212(+)